MTRFAIISMLRVHPNNDKNYYNHGNKLWHMSNNNFFTARIYANHSDGMFVNFVLGFLHIFQTLSKQRLPNVYISMITSNMAIKLKCWAIVHDINWPLYYTLVSILQCPKTPKQIFVAKYLFLEQSTFGMNLYVAVTSL